MTGCDDLWCDAVETLLHLVWIAAALLPALLLRSPIGGALSGLAFALPRELLDQWPIQYPLDTAWDLLTFAAGGALAALLARRFAKGGPAGA